MKKKIKPEQNKETIELIKLNLNRLLHQLIYDWSNEDTLEFSNFLEETNYIYPFLNYNSLQIFIDEIKEFKMEKTYLIIDESIKNEEKKRIPNSKPLFLFDDKAKKSSKIHYNFIMKILYDLFPGYHDSLLDCIDKGKAELVGDNLNYLDSIISLAQLFVDNGYRKELLLFLDYFYIKGEILNKNTFKKEISKTRRRKYEKYS